MSEVKKSNLPAFLLRILVVMAITSLFSLLASGALTLTVFIEVTAVTWVTYNLLGFLSSFPLLMLDPRPVAKYGVLCTSVLVFAGFALSAHLFALTVIPSAGYIAGSIIANGVVGTAIFWVVRSIGVKFGQFQKIGTFLPVRE